MKTEMDRPQVNAQIYIFTRHQGLHYQTIIMQLKGIAPLVKFHAARRLCSSEIFQITVT